VLDMSRITVAGKEKPEGTEAASSRSARNASATPIVSSGPDQVSGLRRSPSQILPAHAVPVQDLRLTAPETWAAALE
jgi:hypothetical protein